MSSSPFSCERLEQRQLLSGAVGASAASAAANAYTQTNLVSDGTISAAFTDKNLVNPWGVAFNTRAGVVWVGDNATSVSTVYRPDGSSTGLVVAIPHGSASTASAPTGVRFNRTGSFQISNGTTTAPAVFLFASEDGTISAWNPTVDPTNAKLVVDNSASNAIYKGLDIGNFNGNNYIYAANFHAGTIDVFKSDFTKATLPGSFTDPNLPAGFAPFNIQNINGQLYVTYAKQDPNKEDDVPGVGLGFVDVFNTDGTFVRRFASGGNLNAPWAITTVPGHFGRFGGDILVGNFGDGRINVFSPGGRFLTQLHDSSDKPITIDGLWGLAFQPTATTVGTTRVDTLFFASGPNDEMHGLFGTLRPITM
ncbi:MAG: TIGR03118 family protein [Bacillota bacterium]